MSYSSYTRGSLKPGHLCNPYLLKYEERLIQCPECDCEWALNPKRGWMFRPGRRL